MGRVAATDGHNTEEQARYIEDREHATGYTEYGCLGYNNLRRQGGILRIWYHTHKEGKANIVCSS